MSKQPLTRTLVSAASAHPSFEATRRIIRDAQPLLDNSAELANFAQANDLTVDEVRLYADAWAFGGDEGISALLRPDILPERVARRAATNIRNLLLTYYSSRRDIRVTDEGTAIGVYHIRYYQTGVPYLHPIAQLRASLSTRHWHLYTRENGVWRPYAPPAEGRYRYTLKTRVQQIVDDRDGRFWQ